MQSRVVRLGLSLILAVGWWTSQLPAQAVAVEVRSTVKWQDPGRGDRNPEDSVTPRL